MIRRLRRLRRLRGLRGLRARTVAGGLAAAMVVAGCSGAASPADPAGSATDAAGGPADPTSSVADDAGSPTAPVDADTGAPSDADTVAPSEGDADEPGEGDAAVLAVTATAPDGTVFAIDDHAGTPVFVETFATWCSTCRRQLGSTQQAAVEAGDDAVFLVLSVETDLDPARLAAYAEDNGFTDLQFGVLDGQGLVTLEATFGRSVLNAPSTPKFRVTPQGEVSELTTGLESVEEILATLATS